MFRSNVWRSEKTYQLRIEQAKLMLISRSLGAIIKFRKLRPQELDLDTQRKEKWCWVTRHT